MSTFHQCFLVVLSLSLVACSASKTMQWAGGNKANGIVELSYTVDRFEIPVVDLSRGLALAREKCKSWGYRDAERCSGLSGLKKTCISGDCGIYEQTVSYQCLRSEAH